MKYFICSLAYRYFAKLIPKLVKDSLYAIELVSLSIVNHGNNIFLLEINLNDFLLCIKL